ncbi:hypothetical protein ISS21_00225 [Patescibacteria group bacterium]|nr:hypothetical protein [Patescibacteria group bacterium]
MSSKPNFRLLILLVIFGVLAISLGYLQIKGAIHAPFRQTFEAQEMPSQAEVFAILANQDTDKDGLSDFDEKFVHQTSVYIADSDSDGYSDKEEIDAGGNPLDPESTPYRSPPISSEEKGILEEIVPAPPRQDYEGQTPEGQLLDSEISIKEIRDLLVKRAGLGQEIVDKLDDKTLKNLYNETKQETGIDLRELKTPDDLMRQFSDLDISQLRQLLISQGVDQEMLDSFDDETLRSMFLQSLMNFELK